MNNAVSIMSTSLVNMLGFDRSQCELSECKEKENADKTTLFPKCSRVTTP